MSLVPRTARLSRRKVTIKLTDLAAGEATARTPFDLIQRLPDGRERYFFEKIINWKYNAAGFWELRQGLAKLTNTALPASPKAYHVCTVASVEKKFAGANSSLYYLDAGNDPQLIGVLEGSSIYLLDYGDDLIICDGAVTKKYDGTTLRILYDVGGYLLTNLTAGASTNTTLYTGSVTRAGQKFTTATWAAAAWTIPIISLKVKMFKTGTPPGTMVAKIFDSVGTTLLATSDTVSANYITPTTIEAAETITFTFTTKYSCPPNTAIRVVVEYDAGDVSNKVHVVHSAATVSGNAITYTSPTWTDLSSNDCVCEVTPGVGPKSTFGIVDHDRLHLIGDPDYPARRPYSNVNNADDWSTTNGSGYLTFDDPGEENTTVTTIAKWIDGTYSSTRSGAGKYRLHKVTGTTPANFVVAKSWDIGGRSALTFWPTANDITFLGIAGVSNIKGVEQYGDIRFSTLSDPIQDQIDDYATNAAFGIYNPTDGQYWLQMAGNSFVNVYHVGGGGWSRYYFNITGATPTCFSSQETVYIGMSNGHIYYLDPTAMQDDGNDYTETSIKTATIDADSPMDIKEAQYLYLLVTCEAGGNFDLVFYRDGSLASFLTKTFYLEGDLLLSEATMLLSEADFYFSVPSAADKYKRINFNWQQVAFEINNHNVNIYPLRLGKIILENAMLSKG